MTAPPSFCILQANPADVPLAMNLLFGQDWSEVGDDSLSCPPEPPGLFVAKRGEQVVGAGWARHDQEGGCSLVLPRILAGESPTTAHQLFRQMDLYSRRSGDRIAFCLLSTSAVEVWQERLRASYYQVTATFLSLVCLDSRFPVRPPPILSQLRRVDRSDLAVVRQVIGETFVASLDCPNLPAFRGVEDSIVEDRHDHSEASLLWENDEPIGCLVLADHPADESLELAYVGLIPRQRGRGLGRELTEVALWRARQLNRIKIVTTVDTANTPAIDMYVRLGFIAYDESQLYFRGNKGP